jgi:formate dehydrogenase major subunit
VDTLQTGVVWMPFHYAEGANILTDAHHLDPVSKIPGYKVVGVKLEKVDAETAARLSAEVQEKEIAYYRNEEPDRIRFKEQSVEDLL